MIGGDLLLGALAAALLILPGWHLARRAGVAQPVLAGFVIGTVGWMWLILGFDAAGVPLGRGRLGIAWAMVIVITAMVARRAHASPPGMGVIRSHWRERAWLAFLLPAFAVVTYRAIAQPLHGVDTVFRWDFLARQLLQLGTLEFYPPVTAEHYEHYSWPDGIAPVVSSLYAAAYALAGSTRATLTAPLVVLQFALLVAAVHGLAKSWHSERAASLACALIGSAAIVPWATGMGQETGLTAIALTAMIRYLPRHPDDEPGLPSTALAGLAAALGSLTREYGLVLIPFGLVLCLSRRLGGRHLLAFAVTSLATCAPWYLRNWIRTGNPLFNLSPGDIFPVNDVHSWLQASYLEEFGASQFSSVNVMLVVTTCGPLLIAGVIGACIARRSALELSLIVCAWIILWLYSIGYTAAGFTYSLRVLNPALALCAVLGGLAGAQVLRTARQRIAAMIALGLLSTDAAIRALTLPANSHRLSPTSWLAVGGAVHEYHHRPIYREIVRVGGGRKILVLGPNALLTTLGARAVPIWSPAMRFLFESDTKPEVIAQRLHAAGVGLIVLNRGAANERFLAHSAFFREPGETLRAVWSDPDMVVLRLNRAESDAETRK